MAKIKKPAPRKPIKSQRLGSVTISVQAIDRPPYTHVTIMRRDGKRLKERYHKTKMEALDQFQLWTIESANHGNEAARMTDSDKRAVADFYDAVRDWGTKPTLAQALKRFLEDHSGAGVGMTVTEAADAHIQKLQHCRLSKRHIDGTRTRLARFSAVFGDRRLNSITGAEISSWLHGLGAAPVTQRNWKLAISPLFTAAVKRGELDRNPLVVVETAKDQDDKEPEIFTPAEVTRFMGSCPQDLRAVMAIQFFAGIRSAEALRLTWDKVSLAEGHIEISASKSKTASRRLVTITANLREWLEPLAQVTGPIAPLPDAYRHRLDAYRSVLKFTWKKNAARHSFISYMLALKDNAALVAKEAGNSEGVIHRDYKALVTKREAELYFGIMPPKGAKVIQMHIA